MKLVITSARPSLTFLDDEKWSGSISWPDSFSFALGSEDCSGIAGVTCKPLPSLHCSSALLLCGFLCEAVCEGVHQCGRGQKVTEVGL